MNVARVVRWVVTVVAVMSVQALSGRAMAQTSVNEWAAGGTMLAMTESGSDGMVDLDAAIQDVDEAHAQIFDKDRFPSATSCADCHPKHYRQWSVSQHAYAQMSPIFNAMAGKILLLTNGTNGDFCIRCHTPVGMNLGEPEFASNIDRHPTSREGVTCIVCHRVNQAYGKLSGRLAIHEGPITEPIFGPVGDNTELNRVIDETGLVTEYDPDNPTRKVHGETDKFFQISTSGHCGSCHDVTLVNGFRLEEAFSEFKNTPANAAGVTCQDCHMGVQPGKIMTEKSDPDFIKKNYDFGPAAQVGSVETAPRKLTNHMFIGPDYSVLHPALFPLHPDIKEEGEKGDVTVNGWTIRQWLTFDWKAGWGDEIWEYETDGPDETEFPTWDNDYTTGWDSPDDREAARFIVMDNLRLLKQVELQRLKLLRTGYVLGDVKVEENSSDELTFKIQVKNGTDGHNVPTGFDAERLVWLYVRVYDKDDNMVMVSGDLDPNGDLRDLHSLYVHNHELPQDRQLFSLQSRFLVRMLRGGEREQVLAVNYSPSVIPFIRPEARSVILQGRPSGARKHKMGIDPLGERWPEYTVDKSKLGDNGPYRIAVQLKTAMVPVNLLNEILDVGFDYNMSPRDIADNLSKGHSDAEGNPIIWRNTLEPPGDPESFVNVGEIFLYQGKVVEVGWLQDGMGTVQQEMDIKQMQKDLEDEDLAEDQKAELKKRLDGAVAEVWHIYENMGLVPISELEEASDEEAEEYRKNPDANRVVGHQVVWEKEVVVDPK